MVTDADLAAASPRTRTPVVVLAGAQEWTARSLASVLEPAGYAVRLVHGAGDAARQIAADPPDAVIVDLQAGDGAAALARRLRDEGLVTPSTAILVFPAAAVTREERLELLRAGADEVLRHPLDAEELLLGLASRLRAKLDADRAREARFVDFDSGLYTLRGLAVRAREMDAAAARRHEPLACLALAVELPEGPAAPDIGRATDAALALAVGRAARRSDAVARIGVGAFAVLAPLGDAPRVRRLAARLAAAALAALPPAADRAPAPRGGYALTRDLHDSGLDALALFARATTALHSARTGGRWLRAYAGEG